MVPSETGLRIHQFIIPQTLVGLLIGKYGSFVTKIKAKTGATVYVRRHPDLVKQKICAIEGNLYLINWGHSYDVVINYFK